MKLGLTEKQYKNIISKLLEQSEAEPVSSEPEAGTSSAQTGGKGYPQVGKWESGVTRGPGNQVGVTKWSDVVGAKLTRGKGNQLKEQNDLAFDRRYGTADAAEKSNRENKELVNWVIKVTNWAAWGQWALSLGSIAAACLIPGAQGLWISIGLDVIAAADLYFREDDNVGAGISVALAFVPVLGKAMPFLKITSKDAARLLPLFKNLKTEKEVASKIATLSNRDRELMRELMKLKPEEITKVINKEITKNGITNITNLNQAKKVVNQLNGMKLDIKKAKWWVQRLSLQRFGFDVSVSGVIVYGGLKYKVKKEEDKMINRGSNEKVAKPEDFEN
jgi:hypothetical protein